MKKQNVYDPLISKRQQYLLATQLVRAVLKIGELSLVTLFVIICLIYFCSFSLTDDVIVAGEHDE